MIQFLFLFGKAKEINFLSKLQEFFFVLAKTFFRFILASTKTVLNHPSICDG